MTDNVKSQAINECRAAYAAMIAALDNWAVVRRKYDALALGDDVEDGDFSDGLLAAEFTTAAASMNTLETTYATGHNTNLHKAAL